MKGLYVVLLFILSLLHYQCQKEPISVNRDHRLAFSTDTMVFDTVFTTIGSSTRNFRVYNPNRQSIEISSVRLAGGANSPFRMNVDGEPTNHAQNLTVAPGDSLFVFVEVTIDPNNQNSPLRTMDSIVFETNGNLQDVKLVAWGQDVHLYDSLIVKTQHTLTADKPHLIYNYILVEKNAKLVIEAGARLHFHNNAVLAVLGTLEVKGEPDNRVVFEGDRLERFYRDKAGQWYGIWMGAGSHSNHVNWAEIKNAVIGITVDTFMTPGVPTLTIHNSRIENMSGAALHGRGAIIEAVNCLFANAAQVVLSLKYGGSYRFIHCTIANFWGYYVHRKSPAVLLNNFYISEDRLIIARDMHEAYFGNCIIYGSYSDELEINNTIDGVPVNAKMEYLFESSILRVTDKFDLNNTKHFRNVKTDDPKFIKPSEYNYLIDSVSPARGIALPALSALYPYDLNGNSRLGDGSPDLGAFEWVPSSLPESKK